jgi:hypothetical protein
MPHPWEQQPDEGDRAFAALTTYLEMGANERSLEKVAQKLAKSIPIIKTWSSKYAWSARARAFDAYLRDLELQMQNQEIQDRVKKWATRREQLLEKEWELSQKLLERAREMLEWPLTRQVTEKDGKVIVIMPMRWNASTAVRYLDLASRLGRLAVGEVTARTASDNSSTVKLEKGVSDLDYSKLSDDELEAFLMLIKKATKQSPDTP